MGMRDSHGISSAIRNDGQSTEKLIRTQHSRWRKRWLLVCVFVSALAKLWRSANLERQMLSIRGSWLLAFQKSAIGIKWSLRTSQFGQLGQEKLQLLSRLRIRRRLSVIIFVRNVAMQLQTISAFSTEGVQTRPTVAS